MNLLKQGTIILLIFGLICFIYIMYDFLAYHFEVSEYISDFIPLVLFIFIIIGFYFSLVDAHYHLWDEFTHWGRSIKELIFYNSLPTAHNTTLKFPDYPPIVSLFHYYFSYFLGFSEGITYVSMSCLIFSSLWSVLYWGPKISWDYIKIIIFFILVTYFFMYVHFESYIHTSIYDNIYRGPYINIYTFIFITFNLFIIFICFFKYRRIKYIKNIFLFFFIFAILFLSVYVIGLYYDAGFQSLYVDTFLGVYFGSSLLLVSYIRKSKKFLNILLLFPILISLPLIKKPGLYLSLILALYTFIIFTVIFLSQINRKNNSRLIFKLLVLAFMFILPIISFLSWKNYSLNQGFENKFEPKIKLSMIAKAFSSQRQSNKEKKIIKAFYKNFISIEGLPITAAIVFLITISTIAIYLKENNKERVSSILQLSLIWIGGIGYICGLLILYIFAFKYDEAIELSSFWRYSKIYLISLFLVILQLLLIHIRRNKQKQKVQIITLILIFILFSYITCTKFLVFSPLPVSNLRKIIQSKVIHASKNINNKDTVYVISRTIDGMGSFIAYYELMPLKTINAPGDIGPKFTSKDKWTKEITIKQFTEYILKSNYFLLVNTDKEFWLRYGKFLMSHGCNKLDFLYKVNKYENGNFKLKAI
ncbi:MAG: hypothetical protein GY756_22740 [bacterium]|nr:hypothetical protein [bacterium]